MLDVFHIAKPQGCDIQTFYGSGPVINNNSQSWVKPRGVSHVYMLLIGSGGNGNGSQGGGSGGVTVWYGAAQNVPDQLEIFVGSRGYNATVKYRTTTGTAITLIEANTASSVNGGAAYTANQFCASGFFQSVAGQAGSTVAQTASATTFLSGGSGAPAITSNYGYGRTAGNDGYFVFQPIIVGVGGNSTGPGGIGCGGGWNSGSGGPAFALIASW